MVGGRGCERLRYRWLRRMLLRHWSLSYGPPTRGHFYCFLLSKFRRSSHGCVTLRSSDYEGCLHRSWSVFMMCIGVTTGSSAFSFRCLALRVSHAYASLISPVLLAKNPSPHRTYGVECKVDLQVSVLRASSTTFNCLQCYKMVTCVGQTKWSG